MPFEDRWLQCVECGAEFVWTAGEQAFFAEQRLEHEPRRCRACKARRGAAHRSDAAPAPREREETAATCSACGRATTLPFRPTPGRPVYCRECFQQRKHPGG